jgi:hypothetical protein
MERNMMRCFIGFFLGTIILNLLTGCSSPKPDGMPQLYPVEVTVIGEGRPIADVMVTLMPIDSNSRWASGGETNTLGVAVLKTQGVYAGAATGKYKVCISKIEIDPIVPVGPDETPPPVNSYHLIDPKFFNIETAQEVEVTAKKNTWTINVGKPVRKLIETKK